MKKRLIILLSLGIVFSPLLSSCTTEQLASIENPTDLSKEVKIDTSKLDISIIDIDELKKRLATKPVIPEKRETVDLKDPFVMKSLKALRVQNVMKNQEEEEDKKDSKEKEKLAQDKTTMDEGKQMVNIAEESPMMFNFEGLSISGNEKRAILRHLVNNRAYIVKKGAVVGGYSVIDITEDSLVLIKGNEKLVITKKKK
ncbi:MAG: hypothetical protein ACK4SW_06925 [Sulfurihydrogenibium azorense]